MPNAHSGVQTLAYYIEMSFTVLFAPVGGVTSGCHSSNSQLAGYNHTCAILDGGGVKCWGRGDHGRLGYDSTDNKGDAAGEMAGLGTVNLDASAIAITAGWRHTCAILDGGGVKCWGRGDYGQLGYDSTDNKGDAAGEMAGLGTVNLGASAIAIAAGWRHTCAILDGGGVKCWGYGAYGRLGYDSTDNKGDAAGEMAGLGTLNLGASAIVISAGRHHTCAIIVGGGVKRWGRNDVGQLGYDSRDSKGDEAGEMAGLGTVNLGVSAIAIAAGGGHTCAILDGGGVKCWGQGTFGRLGYGSSDDKGGAVGDMAGLGTVNLGTSALAITALAVPTPARSSTAAASSAGVAAAKDSLATTALTTRATRPARWRALAPLTSTRAPSPSRPASTIPARPSSVAASSAGGGTTPGSSATIALTTRVMWQARWRVWAPSASAHRCTLALCRPRGRRPTPRRRRRRRRRSRRPHPRRRCHQPILRT